MQDDPPNRKSTRLAGWHYGRPGYYFLTLCSAGRTPLFGAIIDGAPLLSDIGRIAEEELIKSTQIRERLSLVESIVMPNHLHFIVALAGKDPAGAKAEGFKRSFGGREADSISSFVGGYKAAVTSAVRTLTGVADFPVWHRGFFEHVIRTDNSLYEIRLYIQNNPLAWELDHYNPSRRSESQPDQLESILKKDAGIRVVLDF